MNSTLWLLIIFLSIASTLAGTCTEGIPSLTDVQELTGSCSSTSSCLAVTANQGSTFIIPDMHFTCEGTIIGWSAGAAERYTDGNENRNPALQIWTQDTSDPSTYHRRTLQEIPLLSCNGQEPGSSNNVYHCDLRPAHRVTVQPGDILGMYLARNGHRNFDRFPVFFDTSSQSASDQLPYHKCSDRVDVCSNEGGRALPLITLDVMPTSPSSLTTQTTNSPMTPSQTTGAPTTLPQMTADALTTPPQMADARRTPPQTADARRTPPQMTDAPTMPPQTTDAPTTPPQTTDAPTAPPQTTDAPTTPPQATDAPTTLPQTTDTPSQTTAAPTTPTTVATPETTTIPTAPETTTTFMTPLDTPPSVITPTLTTPNETTSTSSPTTPSDGEVDESLQDRSSGVIVGIVVAILLAVLIAIFLAYIGMRHFRKMKKKRMAVISTSPVGNPSYVCVAAENMEYEEIRMATLNRSIPGNHNYQYLPINYEDAFQSALQRQSVMEFEVMNNPNYILGVFVPSEEERVALSLKRQTKENTESVYQTLAKDQFGSTLTTPPMFFTETPVYWAPASNSKGLYRQLSSKRYREIIRQQIRVMEYLGSGQFGTVNRGLWEAGPDYTLECAIKTLKVDSNEEESVKFLQEAAINGQFHHPNIVQLLGVVTLEDPVMIVLELVTNGDLLAYMCKMRPSPGELMAPSTACLLLSFCQQVASGMEYLSRKKFVHRDLAARNILVTEEKTCKISDFGMSRRTTEDYYISKGGQIPVKWTAPEAIHYKKYSPASDVWSFGAVMYEIWSIGYKPFEDYDNNKVIDLVDQGLRLAPPPGCPRALYHLMIQCWNPNSKQRPQFHRVVQSLKLPESELIVTAEDLKRGHGLSGCGPTAAMLGAPLQASATLYPDLQQVYC